MEVRTPCHLKASFRCRVTPTRSVGTQAKAKGWLDKNVFPVIAKKPIDNIKPRDVLAAVQKMETRGAVESVHRVKLSMRPDLQVRGGVRLSGTLYTTDLRGAIAPTVKDNFPAITEPKQVGALMRAISDYYGFLAAMAALKLVPSPYVHPVGYGSPSGR